MDETQLSNNTENQTPQQPATNDPYATKKAIWERKLLDLGLRNQLINMRQSRSLIPLITISLNELEDILADGSEFTITAKPEKFVLPEDYTYENLIKPEIDEELLKKEFADKHLFSIFTEGELKKSIKEVYRAAKNSIEENGANTLYLALGLLKWFETKTKTPVARYAPILLLPIDITRKSAGASTYAISLRDDDPQLNITMLEKLKQDFGIAVGGLDPLPLDEHGLDIKKIFETIKECVKDQPDWDILEMAAIGVFSFSSFVMWNDLVNRSEDLAKNKLVKSLLEGKLTWDAESMATEGKVDENNVFMAMPTDASQLFAVKTACESKSFVLHGPPGTGKSQTITTLIANALGQDKTVLFVAEKMAALSVVQKRLASIGLDPFCLELHSNKARKKAVLEKLQQTMEFRRPKATDDYQKKADEIAKLRQELDVYSAELHKKQPCGLSIYQLINDYELYSKSPELPQFSAEVLGNMTPELITKQQHIIDALVSAGRSVGHPTDHALARVGASEYNQSLKEELNSRTQDYLKELEELKNRLTAFINEAGLSEFKDDAEYSKILGAAEQVQKWAVLPKDWAEMKSMNITMAQVAEMAQHFAKAKTLKAALDKNWKPEFYNQDGHLLSSNYQEKSTSWFIPKFFGMWSLKSKLKGFTQSGSINEATLGSDLADLKTYQTEKTLGDELFRKHSAVIDSLYDGDNTDWEKVAAYATDARESTAKLNEFLENDELRIKLCTQKSILESAKNLYTSIVSRETARENFAKIAQPKPEDGFEKPLDGDIKMCQGILKHIDEIKEWTLWNHTASEAESDGLSTVVEAYRKGMDHDEIMGAYRKSISKGLAAKAIDASQTLNNFAGKVFTDKVERFIALDAQVSALGNREVVYRLASRLPDFTKEAAQSSELGILQRAIKSGGRGTSLRKLFGQIPNMLPKLCPCMLMSPISAAQYIDPERAPFDLVIFDEASQLTTSKAVGALARGKDAIVVGDPKQMPPTSFFSSNALDEENLEIEDMESILDDCLALNMPQTHLLWHYRSRHESLIAFSNHKFYESKLYTFPSVDDRQSKVTFVHVDGTFDHGSGKRYNRKEAEAVVEELKRRAKDPKLSKYSVGVVTFNISQQNLIDDLFSEACKEDIELEAWAYKGEDPLFIKNLENVQGDERDVILFSIAYGPDSEGKVSMNFGPINKEGGWRRLNVAVSRSKREMKIFSSLLPEHISPERTKAEGALALKAFLDYARNPKGLKAPNASACEAHKSGIIQSLSELLQKQGYDTDCNIGNSEFKVDLGIVDPRDPGRYILGILLDGPVYNDCRTTRDRELSQISVLRGLGWNIVRLWSMDWWESREQEIDKLLDLLDKLKNDQSIEPENKADPKEELKPVEYEEAGAAAAGDTSASTYTAAQLNIVSMSSDDFMARKNAAELKKRTLEVIKCEAPITENLLTKRLLNSYSITRVGSRVQTYLDEFYAKLGAKTTKQADGQTIYWNSKQEPDNYTDFRAGKTDNDKRDSKDIPIIEAANAVLKVVTDNVALSAEDLNKLAAKQLGFARMGANLTSLMDAAVEMAKSSGKIEVMANGNISLTKCNG